MKRQRIISYVRGLWEFVLSDEPTEEQRSRIVEEIKRTEEYLKTVK